MPDLVDRFCDEHWTLNGISLPRRREQRKVLRAFEDHIGKELIQATSSDLTSFMTAQVADGRHPNTVRKYRGLIMPFFRWAKRQGLIDRLALLDLRETPNPRGAVSRGEPRPYNRAEMIQFWRDLDATYPPSEYYYKRWQDGRSKLWRAYTHTMNLQIRAIVSLALYCGLRRSEIFRAEIVDIHPDNEYVVVRHPAQKGNGRPKPARQVPMTVGASDRMRPWFDFLELADPPHDRPWLSLYQQHALKPMSAQRFAELLGTLPGGWQLHRFRHTSGTLWLRTGMPLQEVKEFMGHARIEQTLAYARVAYEDVLRTAERLESEFDRAVGEDDDEEAVDAA